MHSTIKNHLVTEHVLESVGKFTISTIDLTESTLGILKGYETCVFWPTDAEWAVGGEDSEVVDVYGTWAEAAEAHATWTVEKAAKFMLDQHLQQDGNAAGHGR
jgi:hypothetical protein